MNNQPLELGCVGISAELCALLKFHLEQAAATLEMGKNFSKITLILDDFTGCADPWLHFEPTPIPGIGFSLDIHVDPEIFGQARGGGASVFPQAEVWEAKEAPRQDLVFDMEHFRPDFCLQFLHHHLLMARDLARRDLIPGRVPSASAQSYQVCWAVTVDGRLEKWGLPGFALPERRRYFSHHFSLAGVLLPCHWNIFQALWEGAISGQGPVLEAVGGLPRL